MIKHFQTRKQARTYLASLHPSDQGLYQVRKKIKGQWGYKTRPFVVCSYIEFLNLN